jgi:pyroglutamyl-peptidase
MFGLHGRTRTLRIETLARNALSHARDASGKTPYTRSIVAGASPAKMASPASRLVRAARSAGAAAVTSRDAGQYLCNYLCWRATEATNIENPRLAAFIHVPPVSRKTLRPRGRLLTSAKLEHAARAIVAELIRCLGSGAVRS